MTEHNFRFFVLFLGSHKLLFRTCDSAQIPGTYFSLGLCDVLMGFFVSFWACASFTDPTFDYIAGVLLMGLFGFMCMCLTLWACSWLSVPDDLFLAFVSCILCLKILDSRLVLCPWVRF